MSLELNDSQIEELINVAIYLIIINMLSTFIIDIIYFVLKLFSMFFVFLYNLNIYSYKK